MAITAADLVASFRTEGVSRVEGDARRVGSAFDHISDRGRRAGGFLKTALAFTAGSLMAEGVRQVTLATSNLVGGVLDFGAQMANVNSIMQVSDAQLRALSQDVLALASDSRVAAGPAELAAGLYEISSSGFQGAAGLQVLEKAAIAATAGITSADIAAKAITAGLNAYGLSADQAGRISDVMFQTVNEGVITFEQLANNLGNTLSPANALGVSIEELGAAYAQMTLKGVSASMAETQIASLFKSSLNPTEALTAAMQAHGFASAQAAIESEGFAGFLQIVMAAAGGNEQALYGMLGTQEAVNAALILGANDAASYAAAVDRMNNSTGATQAALEKQMQSARYQLGQVIKQLQVFATEILLGFEPMVARGAKAVAGFVGDLTDMAKFLKDFVTGPTQIHTWGEGLSSQALLLEKIPTPLRGAAVAMATVTKATIDMGKGFIGAFQAGKGVEQLVQTLPTSMRGFGRAVFTFADDLGDIVRQIRQGDWSGLIEELKDTGRHVVNVAIDIAVSLGRLILRGVTSLWDWIKDQLGVGRTRGFVSGIGPEGGFNNRDTITIGDVAIDAGIQLGGTLAAMAENVWGWIEDHYQNIGDKAFTVGNLVLRAGVEVAGLVTDVARAIGQALITANWGFLFGQQFNIGERIGEALRDAVFAGVRTVWEDPATAAKIALFIVLAIAAVFLAPVVITLILTAALITFIAGAIKGLIFGADDVDWTGAVTSLVMWLAAEFIDAATAIKDAIIDGIEEAAALFAGSDLSGIASTIAVALAAAIVTELRDALPGPIADLWLGGSSSKNGTGGTALGRRSLGYGEANIPGVDPVTFKPIGRGPFEPSRPGGGAAGGGFAAEFFLPPEMREAPGILQAVGRAAVDAATDVDTHRAALDAMAQSYQRATAPVDLFAGQTDQAMQRVSAAVGLHTQRAAASLNTALASAMAQAATNAQRGASGVDQAFAWLPGALFGRGANASQAFANGLWSGVPAAQAAARALAAAADQAVQSRLAIGSPSRVFQGHAENAADSFIDTLNRRQGDIAAAYGSAFTPQVSTSAATARPADSGGRRVLIVQQVVPEKLVDLMRDARIGREYADGFAAEFDSILAGQVS